MNRVNMELPIVEDLESDVRREAGRSEYDGRVCGFLLFCCWCCHLALRRVTRVCDICWFHVRPGIVGVGGPVIILEGKRKKDFDLLGGGNFGVKRGKVLQMRRAVPTFEHEFR